MSRTRSAIRIASWPAAIAGSRPSRGAGASPRTWCGRSSSRWRRAQGSRHRGCSDQQQDRRERNMKARIIAALAASLAFATPALAVEWNFYHHQSAPLFATSRGAKMLAEELEKSTNGEFKARLHLSGTLQIAPNNITPAVAEGVVQLADDLFNSGNIPLAGIPRLPGLVRSYEEYAKTAEVLRPYLVKAFADKGIVMIGEYTSTLQVVWVLKKHASLVDCKVRDRRVS